MTTTQSAPDAAPGVNPGKTAVIDTAEVTARDVRLAFLAVGALIECGSIPLPNLKQDGWQIEISIAVLSVAAAFAAAGVTS